MSRASPAELAPGGASPQDTSAPASADYRTTLAEAQSIADAAGRGLSTVDILVAMLRTGGAAARLLAGRGVQGTTIEVLSARVRRERSIDLAEVSTASREIALGLAATQTTSLHLLLALLRSGGSATEALQLAGLEPARLRGIVMRAITGHDAPNERWLARTAVPPLPGPADGAAGARSPVPATTGPQPAPGLGEASAEVSLGPAASRLVPLEPPRAPVLHREREIGRLLDLLQARTARVIAVLGESGAGRSSLLAALAAASMEPPVCPAGDLGAPASMGALLQSLHRQAPGDVPIVLEGASWLGPEGGDGVPQLLSLANAGRRFILTLTPADVRRIEIAWPDLANAIEPVLLPVPEPTRLQEMVESGLDALAASAHLGFSQDVVPALLRLSPRYPSERAQPGRALAIAEVAIARAQRHAQRALSAADVAAVVGDASGIPASQLLRDDHERFRLIEERLAERVVGHATARGRIAAVLRRSYAGFRGHRPLASLLLLGPTGVGKTETARAIAEALFDGEAALVRVDLSEYSEAHSVARLIGAPPGYLAHEDGGQLTEAIRRRPASVILLDELEKAHREVLLVLLQVLEDGRLTDGRGRTVDFSAAAVVMTSNLGSECYRRNRTPTTSTIVALARSRLPPELWNRIDEVLCYAPLSEADLAAIVGRIAHASSLRLQAERGISYVIDERVVAEVLRLESDRSLGARPLRRAFERLVEDALANEILAGGIHRGSSLRVSCGRGGEVEIVTLTSR